MTEIYFLSKACLYYFQISIFLGLCSRPLQKGSPHDQHSAPLLQWDAEKAWGPLAQLTPPHAQPGSQKRGSHLPRADRRVLGGSSWWKHHSTLQYFYDENISSAYLSPVWFLPLHPWEKKKNKTQFSNDEPVLVFSIHMQRMRQEQKFPCRGDSGLPFLPVRPRPGAVTTGCETGTEWGVGRAGLRPAPAWLLTSCGPEQFTPLY